MLSTLHHQILIISQDIGLSVTATALIAFIAFFIFASLVASFLLNEWQIQKQKAQSQTRFISILKENKPNPHRHISSYVSWLPVTEKDKQALGRLLKQAGFYQSYSIQILVAAKLFLMLLLPIMVISVLETSFSLALVFKLTVSALIGSMLPEWWIKQKAARNMQRLRAAIPDVVDLMVICAQSGHHIDTMLEKVAQSIQDWSPILAKELNYTHADLQVGTDRTQALNKLAQRTEIEEIQHLVTALIQSFEYGSPIVQALKDIAYDARRLYLLRMEEKIGKIPAIISLPLMVFVLLPLVALLAGPSFIMITRLLKGM